MVNSGSPHPGDQQDDCPKFIFSRFVQQSYCQLCVILVIKGQPIACTIMLYGTSIQICLLILREYRKHREYKTIRHISTHFQASPNAVDFLCSCDKVYHKQEVCFLLHLPGQLVA